MLGYCSDQVIAERSKRWDAEPGGAIPERGCRKTAVSEIHVEVERAIGTPVRCGLTGNSRRTQARSLVQQSVEAQSQFRFSEADPGAIHIGEYPCGEGRSQAGASNAAIHAVAGHSDIGAQSDVDSGIRVSQSRYIGNTARRSADRIREAVLVGRARLAAKAAATSCTSGVVIPDRFAGAERGRRGEQVGSADTGGIRAGAGVLRHRSRIAGRKQERYWAAGEKGIECRLATTLIAAIAVRNQIGMRVGILHAGE